MNDIAYLTSPLGPIEIRADENGITMVSFVSRGKIGLRRGVGARRAVPLRDAAGQLDEYFRGKRRKFDLQLSPAGTQFQRSVWRALSDIPYGETVSYADIARDIGNPLAQRAVGQANNKNPVAIIVPCHRVVSANGRLGGYAGGLGKKRWLLKLEGEGCP